MKIARTIRELRALCSELRESAPLALVPTLGALHAGHGALLAAAASSAAVVASVFVNPLQFGSPEDIARYPRDEAGDLAFLERAGCRLAWLPDMDAMYPADAATIVDVAGLAQRWEGAHRPGHFRGVATVVAKLFGQVRPELAFFGEKDWQQLQVVRRMVADLSFPVRVVGVPIVREPDGLALASRNRFLTPPERAAAPRLYAAMREAVAAGTGPRALERSRWALQAAGFQVDYFALVDPESLAPIAEPPGRLIAAAQLGSVRLIDNIAAQL
ncbi:MAG: pantoate--beta-alanine ligase [Acidisphaera sp.]|nr:pantoate--beta-alanine ligase [Acidisphaera sp.]